ncbi:MAG TPA: glycosyltransferase [Terriglobales bacterium]|nr:glycosyltransferase [Terriglobales bacterium]
MPGLSGVAIPADRPIRVLLTTPPTSRRGGVTNYLHALRPYFRNSVQYFPIGSRCDNEGIATAVLRLLRDSWRFARMLRRGSYDIVHLNPSIGLKALLRDGILLVIAKTLHKAVIVFAHGWDDACERILAKRLSRLFRLVYGRADVFIVLGSGFKKRLRLLGYDRAVFVQGAPVDDDLVRDSQRRRLRTCAGVRPSFNILFLARVEKKKGIYEALDTYRIVKQTHPFVSLTVAGDGPELTRAVQYARGQHLDGVVFTGHVEGTAKYEVFKTADAYLFPSHTEGLPISVLEAMAYGLPVVTRAVGGLADFFQDGTMGFITESRDPQVFASMLSRLVGDPSLRSSISVFNWKYARHQFTASQVAAGLEGIYRFVLGGADSAFLRAA